MERTLEQLTAFLRFAGIDPNGYGERIGETREEHTARVLKEWHARQDELEREHIARIVEEDKRNNWPRIQAEMDARANVKQNGDKC